MLFGFQMSVALLMTTANFYLMQPLYDFISQFTPSEHEAMGSSFLISSLSCVLSFLISISLAWIDKTRTRRLASTERRTQDQTEWSTRGVSDTSSLNVIKTHLKALKERGISFAVSLWHKGAYNRFFPYMEATLMP